MSTVKKRLLVYFIMIVSGLISVKLFKDIWRLRKVDSRIIGAEAELRQAEAEQKALKKELEDLESNQWQEKQIRDTLKMARQNEVVVIVPESVIQASETAKISDVTEEDGVSNWQKWQRIFVY